MRIIFLSTFAATAFALPAWAQTNVTLYGLLDTGVHVVNAGVGTQYNLASGIAEGSRFGIKGTEELGNGFKAVFNLEARFETDTGANTNGYPTSNVGEALFAGADADAIFRQFPA